MPIYIDNPTDPFSTRDPISASGILVQETPSMLRAVRQDEQGHLRRKGEKVHSREHDLNERAPEESLEGQLKNDIPPNPHFQSQAYDGCPDGPEPPLNTEARKKYDEAKERQEVEKQLRLGNMPRFGSAPKPQGP